MLNITLLFLLATLYIPTTANCPSQCTKARQAAADCAIRPHCKLELCLRGPRHHFNGKKCVPRAQSPLPPKGLSDCPKICHIDKAKARLDCKYLSKCSVRKCKVNTPGYKKKGFECGDKKKKKPVLFDCPDLCVKEKKAYRACAHLPYKCSVVPCHDGYLPLFKCTAIPKTTSPTPSPSPSSSPYPQHCRVCATGRFLSMPGCRCVNHPCDACPDGTVCRKVADDDMMNGGERFASMLQRLAATGEDGKTVVEGGYICASCECGYCDASRRKCCEMRGANCVANPYASAQQCTYDKFDLLADTKGGEPEGYNVCTAMEGLGLEIAQDVVNTCGCVPNSKVPCKIERNYYYTNCLVPRL